MPRSYKVRELSHLAVFASKCHLPNGPLIKRGETNVVAHNKKMVIRLVFLMTLALAAGVDDPIISHEVRRLPKADNFCPFENASEEKLLYNVDIFVEGVGEGCGEDDLRQIGEILQKVVREVEAGIPEYNYEYMRTVICKMPIFEGDESNRELQTRRVGRYRYRGGGECKRCRKNNNDRRFLQEAVTAEDACQMANSAVDGADLAEKAVENAQEAFLALKETVFECPNLRAGATLFTWATGALKECETVYQEALSITQAAIRLCQQAKRASSESQQPLVKQAAEASNYAMNAIDQAQQLCSEMQDRHENIDVCNQPIEGPSNNRTEEASAMADLATFGAQMSARAVQKANELFRALRTRAMECGDSEVISSARAQLMASRKAKKQAKTEATRSKSLAQQASDATSEEELIQRVKLVEESSSTAFAAAQRARYSYSLIKDELEHPICGKTYRSPPEYSPSTSPTVFPETASPTDGSNTEQPSTGPALEGGAIDGVQENDSAPLKEWLVEFMTKLYDKIPENVVKAYLDAKTCDLEAFNVAIRIDALEQLDEEQMLITKKDCKNLSELPA